MSRVILFQKMVAAGNDFIVLDDRANRLKRLSKRDFQAMCNRKTGIGADGVLMLGKSQKADMRMRIYNPDGSQADMCGNGVRCLSKYAVDRGLVSPDHTVETGAGIIRSQVRKSRVKSKLTLPKDLRAVKSIRVLDRREKVSFIHTGVPHAVIFEPRLSRADVLARGRAIRFHQAFKPQGTNVNFVERHGNGISVRTYERGVEGETLACGTGSTASALLSSKAWHLTSPVSVKTSGGEILKIYFKEKSGRFTDVYLEGTVHSTFKGSMTL